MKEAKLLDSHTWALCIQWRISLLQVFGIMAQILKINRLPLLPLETWLSLLAIGPSLASTKW